ncbi:hypothetical protein EHQ05_19275 [Leptospira yasudae]|nr:hypothetical protein EHQ05_19275 [Leptospira yasudae]TGM09806.1 hypothetical protein EHQ86_00095 [Leptospira yasudae]
MIKVETLIQKDSLKETSKNKIWSFLCLFLWDKIHLETSRYSNGSIYIFDSNQYYSSQTTFFKKLWIYYFQHPIDTIPLDWVDMLGYIRNYFYKSDWHLTYNLIEFILLNWKNNSNIEPLVESLNLIFEQENIAYRILDGIITDITNEQELSEINGAQKQKFEPVREHIEQAILKLYDRKNPDYRNSIKESISAVEACCRDILKDEKATLGKALSMIEKKIHIHEALKQAFDKLYGYTSDSTGIRHSLLEGDNITFEEAKFMLVACSGFINFLYGVAGKRK